MRIVWFLLTATAAAASGPAPAQSVAMSPGRHAASAGWNPGQGLGRHHDFRRGPGRDHNRRDRHHRGRFGRGGDRFDLAIAGIGYSDEFEAVDPHGNGYFAGGGGGIRMQGGRPHYDYDRSYPYEWASAAAGRSRWVVEENEIDEALQCRVEHGVRVCRSRR